jgi:hypothetical protein
VSLSLWLHLPLSEIRKMPSSDVELYRKFFEFYSNETFNPLVRQDLSVGRIIWGCTQNTNLKSKNVYPQYGKSIEQLIKEGNAMELNRRMQQSISGLAQYAEEYKRGKNSRKEN